MSDFSDLSIGKIVINGCYERVDSDGTKTPTPFESTSAFRRFDIKTLSQKAGDTRRANLFTEANIAGWNEVSAGVFEMQYMYLSNPRSIYFMGMQLDIDTGFLLMSLQQNSDSITLLNFYDFMRIILPSFDQDSFLYNLEELKLNSIGNKDTAIEVLGKLAIGSINNIVSDNKGSNSICHEALNATLDSRVSSTNQGKVKHLRGDDLAILMLGFIRDNMEIVREFKRFMLPVVGSSKVNSDNQKQAYGHSSYHYEFEDENNVLGDLSFEHSKIEENQHNLYNDISAFMPPFHTTANDFSEQALVDYVGSYHYGINPSSKSRLDEKLTINGVVYDKTSMDFEPNKIGKALKLYANLEELTACSAGDEATEAYLTLREDYDIAKKQIKKTSIADIVKGSYLTNVLKNKESLHGKLGLKQTEGFMIDLSNVSALNKKFITILRSVLQRI